MAYIGKSIESGTFSVLDTSGNTYNGSNTAFNLGTQVGSVAQLLVSHDGVIQKPGTDYTLSSGGAAITFTTAPASGASIFIVEISGAVGGPLDSDLNGTELILDADGDTSITADTDDQIDIKIAGADDFKFTANTFTANSGSSIIVPDGGLTFGSTAISSTAAELNILDGVTATAAELNLIDGGTSVGSSITVADADGFVVNDGGTMKTIPATDLKTYAGSAYAPDNWQYFVISANQTMSAGASTTISGWTGGAINGRLIYNFGNQYVSESSGIFSFSTEGYYRVILRVSGSTAGATDSSGYIFTTTDNSAYGDAVDVNFSKTSGTGFNFYVDTILKITNTTNHKVKTGIYAATNNVTVAGHGGNATRQRTYLRFERLGTAS